MRLLQSVCKQFLYLEWLYYGGHVASQEASDCLKGIQKYKIFWWGPSAGPKPPADYEYVYTFKFSPGFK